MNSKLDKSFKLILSIFILLMYVFIVAYGSLAYETLKNIFLFGNYNTSIYSLIESNIDSIFWWGSIPIWILYAYILILISYKIIKSVGKIQIKNKLRNTILTLPILLMDIAILLGYFKSKVVLEHIRKIEGIDKYAIHNSINIINYLFKSPFIMVNIYILTLFIYLYLKSQGGDVVNKNESNNEWLVR